MKRVLIRGPLLSKSGYGVHSRQVFKYLMDKKNIEITCQTTPWGITPWYLNREDLDGMVGKIIECSTYKEGDKFDVAIQIQLPNEWDSTIARKNIGITAGVETDKSNPMWASTHCEKMDIVIVPSEHSKKSLVGSQNITTPVHVVPESFFEELLEEPEEINLPLETKFNFLTIGVLTGFTPLTDRKNLMYLIKWFVEEFSGEKDVGLVIKTNRGRETTIDRRGTEQILEKVLNEIGHKGYPKVYLIHGAMSRKEMNSLYKDSKIKAFLSLTRGEGFGLPHLESAVAGLPVIATNWSAHKEFLDNGKWIGVDYDLEKVHETKIDNQIFVKGSSWAFPKEEDAKKRIRTFYEKSEMPTKWAKSLSEKLKETHHPNSINKLYDEVLGGILS